jgi:sterol desaturase/sphingolipid hydroxylase (fatty acid hydroxylase superfamily)
MTRSLWLGVAASAKSFAYFAIFYVVVAIVCFTREAKKKGVTGGFDWCACRDYLLPAEIRRKASFRIDVQWTLLSWLKLPAVCAKLLSTLFFLQFVPRLFQALPVEKLAPLQLLHRWVEDSPYQAFIIFGVALVSFDFGAYWAHRLMHKWSVLWQFHKVHHYAEQINYFSGARTHPLDSFLSFNFAVLCMACAVSLVGTVDQRIFAGAGSYAGEEDWFRYVFIFVPSFVNRLNHSHFPLSFGGILDRVFVSPAFHLRHHSKRVINRNFGQFFALWDVMFSTALLPQQEDRAVDHGKMLGVDGMGEEYYANIIQWLCRPFVDAFRAIRVPRKKGLPQ